MNRSLHGFRTSFVCTIAAVLSPAASAVSQAPTPPQSPKTQVMVLGVYHFDNPNLDYVKTAFDDHRSEKRQKEIDIVIEALLRFRPTRIVVERPPDATSVVKRYDAYRKGEHPLSANETEQLGFRLAKELGHERLYLGDYPLDMDLGAVLTTAQETQNQGFLATFQAAMTEAQAMQDRHARMTVRDVLVELNDPQHNHRTIDLYLQMARVRTKDKCVGADVLADWYKRNLRIFSNVLQAIEAPGDRVLVIFGQGHGAYLREWVKSLPDLALVEPNDYLAPR